MTSSGRYERTVTDVPGDPARPFDAGDVQEKFHRFVAPVIGTEATAQMLKRTFGLLNGQVEAAGLLHQIDKRGGIHQRDETK
jgi:hypothetical protein